MNKLENSQDIEKLIDERVKKIVTDYLKGTGFYSRKITDTPNDDLMVTPRKYVNLYGTTATRPRASVAHLAQYYFDTTIGRPVYFNPNSSVWTDAAGSIS